MNAIITFHEDGNASTLWTDAIPLQTLGELTVKRASTIEWNETDQVWEVRFKNHDAEAWAVQFTDPSRARCIEWEHDQLMGNV